MQIKSYRCNTFAGLKDIKIEFTDGLNVIYGPNESGKSTIIDGIHSVLFKDTSLKRSNNVDKDFIYKYFPVIDGDLIDGSLIIETAKGNFELKKEWGDSPRMELITPENNTITAKTQVNKRLEEIFSFGESTYSNIVFAKQRELKQSLENILRNNEISEEINNVLRMAFMELDGISIDKIEKNILDERESLYKKWDKNKKYPENNRGISNPYKVGLGLILEAYYHKERLKLDMEETERSEKEFEKVSHDLMIIEEKLKQNEEEKNRLEQVEEDVNNREIIRLKIEGLNKEYNEVAAISIKWPMNKSQLLRLDEKANEIKTKKKELKEEIENIKKLERKEDLEKLIIEIEEIIESIKKLENQKQELTLVTEEDIEAIQRLEKEIERSKLTLEVGQLLGKIELNTDKDLYISENFKDKKITNGITEFKSSGYLRINYADELLIEVKTGDIDFEGINQSIKDMKKELEELLNKLDIEDLDQGKEKHRAYIKLTDDIKRMTDRLELKTEKGQLSQLKEELSRLEGIPASRSKEDIEKELSQIERDEISYGSQKMTIENELSTWEGVYGSEKGLLDILVDKKVSINENESIFENLKPLPQGFESVDDFKKRLGYLREEYNSLSTESQTIKEDYFDKKAKLPTESFEELKKDYLEKEKEYERLIQKGEKIDLIYQAFLKTKEKIEENPLEVLTHEFGRLLSTITNDRYKVKEMDEKFNLRISNPKGEIPIDLLSAGTYDTVAIALRFALIKHIFNDKKGYLILDDCLVDLDKDRKIQAVNLIKEFSKDYQIIFTTCDEDTARMLDGNMISLG